MATGGVLIANEVARSPAGFCWRDYIRRPIGYKACVIPANYSIVARSADLPVYLAQPQPIYSDVTICG
jgi:hypothetical protein